MRYGYFDDERREYVITDPRTPMPWANYLGSPAYGAMITQNAGGYSFVKSGAEGRILRYTVNQFDEPGRYLYLRDDETADFWSASWRPVEKPLDAYQAQCRHGLGYTVLNSAYAGVECDALYYVPLHAEHEVWRLTIKNASGRARRLSVFGYCEFSTDSSSEQDQVNLQYAQFITRTDYLGGFLLQRVNEWCGKNAEGENGLERFFGLAGAPVQSYTGRRERFLLQGRFCAPGSVRGGRLDNSLNYNGNPCGALHTTLALAPGESRALVFVLGQKGAREARALLARYEDPALAQEEWRALKDAWARRLGGLKVRTPDERFNVMVNTWNAYQCFITFTWSRAASLWYCGQRNGYGYRDTVQDIQGVMHLAPELAGEKLAFMLSAQVSHGGGLPLVKFTHNAGHEDTPECESYQRATGHPQYRADDALWLFPTVYQYVCETGDRGFLERTVPFADKEEGTVLEHLRRALHFSMEHLGAHGLPAGLYADWNDCLRLGEGGESGFVAFQLYYAARLYEALLPDTQARAADRAWARNIADTMGERINRLMWDGEYYLRGWTEAGVPIGGQASAEARVWLTPQCWAVISGAGTQTRHGGETRGEAAMRAAYESLNTACGLELMTPCYREHGFEGARMLLYNPGTKENGGVFCQPQGWAILAEALLGHGDRAFLYFQESCPAAWNDRADVREAEPYAYTQFVEGRAAAQPGRAHVHWLTGAASTVMVGCVEGILGLRPTPDGLRLCPTIPARWDGFTMDRRFRGKWLHITVDNSAHRESCPRRVLLNGAERRDGLLAEDALLDENEVLVVM